MFAVSVAVPTALAQDESATLDKGIKLFEQGDYLGAQQTLAGIDRSKLDAKQQATRDDYLNRIQIAINMSEKAVRDLEDAETALADKDAAKAERLVGVVLANEYASEAVRKSANDLQKRLKAAPAAAVAPAVVSAPPSAKANGEGNGNTERAKKLTNEADELVRNGKFSEAERLYDEATKLVPGYPEAVEGMKKLALHRQNASPAQTQSLLERIKQEDQINWQRTVAEYRDAEQQIRDHVAGERFDEANQLLIRARQLVAAGKQFADPVEKYESLKSELDALAESVANAERTYNEQKVAAIQREIEDQRAERLRQDQENRARQVEQLMNQAMQHRKDGDLESAINVLRQVSVIDPKYKPARWMADELEDLLQERRGRSVRDEFYTQTRAALNDVEEAKIPWHVELQYPKDWPELISRPERRAPGARNKGLFSALDKPVNVDFKGTPFEQAIETLADSQNLNLIVNWPDLERAGVDRKTAIELTLPREISLKRALTEVLGQVGSTASTNIGFDVVEDAIKVATRATLDKETFTAVYDINDLLQEIPVFNDAPLTDLTQINRRGQADAHRGAEKQSPWSDSEETDDQDDEPGKMNRVQEIIHLIQEQVAPDSWRDRGGSIGTISEIRGQLVVTQNSAAQKRVGDLLGKLREQRAVQIAVEARFVTVSSHYLEELGLDIDLVLNAGNAGMDYISGGGGSAVTDPVLGNALLLPRSFSRLGFTPNTPALGTATAQTAPITQPYTNPVFVPQGRGGSGSNMTPVPVINRVTSFTDPANLGSDVPGSFAGQTIGPALSVFGSFLDNIQVDFLLRATQADSRTSVLTAPRLVLFNGQRSWVAVTIQQSFVSQLNPVVGAGAVAVAPQTDVIDSGAVLDVNATVTSDKRYVTMTLRPGVTRLLDLQTIPFSGGAAGGGFGGGPANQAFIQIPTLSSQRLQTTVTVPDGGTLLIGGQKLASETEVEAGVPILSKIPILKRAYSSRSMVKDEQTLLILIKPKILIQPEQEELAFPSFSPPGS